MSVFPVKVLHSEPWNITPHLSNKMVLDFRDDQDLGRHLILRCLVCSPPPPADEPNYPEMKQNCPININRYSKPKDANRMRSLAGSLTIPSFDSTENLDQRLTKWIAHPVGMAHAIYKLNLQQCDPQSTLKICGKLLPTSCREVGIQMNSQFSPLARPGCSAHSLKWDLQKKGCCWFLWLIDLLLVFSKWKSCDPSPCPQPVILALRFSRNKKSIEDRRGYSTPYCLGVEHKSVLGTYVTLDADSCRNLSKLLCVRLLCICRCSRSRGWTFRQFLLKRSFSCSRWFLGWKLSHNLPCSLPLNGFSLSWLLGISKLPNNFFPWFPFGSYWVLWPSLAIHNPCLQALLQ